MAHSTLSKNGQTTLPKAVREHLNLKPRQKLFYRLEHGRVIMEAIPSSIDELYGCLKSDRSPPAEEEIRAARREYSRKKYGLK